MRLETYLILLALKAAGEASCEMTKRKLLFVTKLVADSPNSQDHLRVFRVLFDFGSQPIDV